MIKIVGFSILILLFSCNTNHKTENIRSKRVDFIDMIPYGLSFNLSDTKVSKLGFVNKGSRWINNQKIELVIYSDIIKLTYPSKLPLEKGKYDRNEKWDLIVSLPDEHVTILTYLKK